MPYAPIKVVLCEDDDLSCANMFYLLTRDLRTVVSRVVTSPEKLLDVLAAEELQPDVVLLDAHYHAGMPVEEVVQKIYEMKPQTAVVCISEYGYTDGEVVKKAVAAGVKGFIDKDDVQFALATAVIQALATGFVYSPTIESHLDNEFTMLDPKQHRIRRWRLHPELQSRHVPVVLQSVLYGITARVIAQELNVIDGKDREKETITRYRDEIYKIIGEGGFYNLTYMDSVNDILTPTKRENSLYYGLEWAFHIVTQPPDYDQPVYVGEQWTPKEIYP